MILLALDPSITHYGWAILEGTTVLDCGVVVTLPQAKKRKLLESSDRLRRGRAIVDELVRVSEAYAIGAVSVEAPTGSQSAKSAALMGMSWGITCTFTRMRGYPVATVTPGDIKKALTGSAKGSKAAVAKAAAKWATFSERAQNALQDVADGQREHIFDAIGAAYTTRLSDVILAAGGKG